MDLFPGTQHAVHPRAEMGALVERTIRFGGQMRDALVRISISYCPAQGATLVLRDCTQFAAPSPLLVPFAFLLAQSSGSADYVTMTTPIVSGTGRLKFWCVARTFLTFVCSVCSLASRSSPMHRQVQVLVYN